MLNNAALVFAPRHAFVARCMDEFVDTFRAVWGHNGPKLLVRAWRAPVDAGGGVVGLLRRPGDDAGRVREREREREREEAG